MSEGDRKEEGPTPRTVNAEKLAGKRDLYHAVVREPDQQPLSERS